MKGGKLAYERLGVYSRLAIELPGNWRKCHRGSRCTEGRYGIVDHLNVLGLDPASAYISLQECELPMHATAPFWMESIVLHVVAGDDADDVLDSDGHPKCYSLDHGRPARRQHVFRPRLNLDGS